MCHSSHFMKLLLGIRCALFESLVATNGNKYANKELIIVLPQNTIIMAEKINLEES